MCHHCRSAPSLANIANNVIVARIFGLRAVMPREGWPRGTVLSAWKGRKVRGAVGSAWSSALELCCSAPAPRSEPIELPQHQRAVSRTQNMLHTGDPLFNPNSPPAPNRPQCGAGRSPINTHTSHQCSAPHSRHLLPYNPNSAHRPGGGTGFWQLQAGTAAAAHISHSHPPLQKGGFKEVMSPIHTGMRRQLVPISLRADA